MGGSKALSYLTTSQFSILAKITLLCLISSDFREGGSEQIHEGAQISEKPPTHDVERFLSILRFDSREKVNALGRYVAVDIF